MAELPRRLADPGTVVGRAAARAAAVVALQCPERQLRDALRLGPAHHRVRVRDGERLPRAEVVDTDHLGDADHGPQLRGRLARVQLAQLADEPVGRRLGVARHLVVVVAVVVVEGHHVDDVDPGVVGHREDLVSLLLKRKKIADPAQVSIIFDADKAIITEVARQPCRRQEVGLTERTETDIDNRIDDELPFLVAHSDDRADFGRKTRF